MIHIPGVDMRQLYRWAGGCGLLKGRKPIDDGFLLHNMLGKVFSRDEFRPFRLFQPRNSHRATLYAYSPVDSKQLFESANGVAPPECLAFLNLRKMDSKLMPASFDEGKRLGFDIRVRPVRRTSKEIVDGRANATIPAGSELDAYYLELLRMSSTSQKESGDEGGDSEIVRERIYSDWLQEKFADIAEITDSRLSHFKRERNYRGAASGFEGPDAIMHGTLQIKNPDAFIDVVRKGLGRHKAYGYGMILLRPPQ